MSECWTLQKKEKKTNPVATVNDAISERKVSSSYEPFISNGFLSSQEGDPPIPIKILRDTGASLSLLAEEVLPSCATATGDHILISGVDLGFISVTLHKIFLKSDLITGYVMVGIHPNLPVKGVSLLLGNDLAGDKVLPNPCMSSLPCSHSDADLAMQDIPGLYPACAVTRAMTKRTDTMSPPPTTNLHTTETDTSTNEVELTDNVKQGSSIQNDGINMPSSTEQLIQAQTTDPELLPLMQNALCAEEAAKVPTCFYKHSGVLMRKWRPSRAPSDEEWQVTHQIVVPKCFRNDVLNLAHSLPLAGHLGVNKTYQKVLTHFYWPGLKQDVVNYCKSCHTCQVAGKPNQKPGTAPLKPILAIEERTD